MIRRDRVAYVLKKERDRAAAATAAVDNGPKRRKLRDPYAEFHELEDKAVASVVDSGGLTAGGSFLEPTPIHLEETTLDDVKQALLLRMDRLEQNVTLMFKRVFTEVITLRKENAILRAKVQEALNKKPNTPARAPPSQPQQTRRTVAVPVVAVTPRPALTKRAGATQLESDYEESNQQFEYDVNDDDDDDDDDGDDNDVDINVDDEEYDKFVVLAAVENKKQERTSFVKVKSEKESNMTTRPTLDAKSRKSIGKTEIAKQFNMPFNAMEDFQEFEKLLSEDADIEQRFIDEFSTLYCPKRDNFVAVLWRAVMTDYVARHICWGGTETKKRCGDMTVTIALQTAFQRRFEDDGIFVRNSMKFLRYANDRIKKHDNYMNKNSK